MFPSCFKKPGTLLHLFCFGFFWGERGEQIHQKAFSGGAMDCLIWNLWPISSLQFRIKLVVLGLYPLSFDILG